METDNFITENVPSKRLKTWGSRNEARDIFIQCLAFNPIPPGLFEGGAAGGGGGGGGGGGRKVPAACNSKTINDNEMKAGGVVKDH